jgi:signal transduction histidine kinase
MSRPVRILHLEDNDGDAALTAAALDCAGFATEITHVTGAESYEAVLHSSLHFDAILADYSLPGYNGLSALTLARELRPDVPFIVVSGNLNEAQAMALVSQGASDYVLKDRLGRLAASVVRTLREAEALYAARQAAEQLNRHAERMAHLQTITAALSQAATRADVIRIVVEQATPALGATTAVISMLSADEQWLLLADERGLDVPDIDDYMRMPVAQRGARVEALETGAAIWIRSQAEYSARYPHLADAYSTFGVQASAYLPMSWQGQRRAVLGIAYRHVQDFHPADRDYMRALAEQCAQALERAQLYDELNLRVAQRTAELHGANQALEREIAKQRLAEAELSLSYEQLRALATDLQSAREEERRRLSRELHDELGGALTALKIDVATARRRAARDPQSLDEHLDAILAAIDGTLHTVRRLAADLRPAVLDDFGLLAALEWQAQEFQTRSGLHCQFVTDFDDLNLGADHSITLLRIMQESLTNVLRHAGASEVHVGLSHTPTQLQLSIQDNGCGFVVADAARKRSLGLVGMRERVHALGGHLDIRSTPGHGTQVSVQIPI